MLVSEKKHGFKKSYSFQISENISTESKIEGNYYDTIDFSKLTNLNQSKKNDKNIYVTNSLNLDSFSNYVDRNISSMSDNDLFIAIIPKKSKCFVSSICYKIT